VASTSHTHRQLVHDRRLDRRRSGKFVAGESTHCRAPPRSEFGLSLNLESAKAGETRRIMLDYAYTHLARGRCTTDAVKSMLAKPENREQALPNSSKASVGT
jgi:hypothetical protein